MNKSSLRKLPNLIIGGATRAGTTSLFTYLSWHPDICASTVKETNYFTPLLSNNRMQPVNRYYEYFKNCSDQSKYVMEATPIYLYGGKKIAEAIYKQLGHIKIIFLLRDPIQRFFSYYKQRKETRDIPANMHFDDYVNRTLESFYERKDHGRGNSSEYIDVYAQDVYLENLAQGFYADYLVPWFNTFGDSVKVYFFRDLTKKPFQFMSRICNWLNITPSIYQSKKFTIENKGLIYKNLWLHGIALTINDRFEKFLRNHFFLKNILRNIYFSMNELTDRRETISRQALKKLESVYKVYNKNLFNIMSSKGYFDFPKWVK